RADPILWEDLGQSRLALVGLRAPGSDRGVVNGRVVVRRVEQVRGEAAVLNIPGIEFVSRDKTLPILRVRIRDKDALRTLRSLPHVDYVEPDLLKGPPGGVFQDVC